MSTASTKSSRKIQRSRGARVELETSAEDLSPSTWLIASISIMAVAALVRLYNLSLVPFHHDEGVNGNFLVHLVRDGVYRYDPENYHGPSLYYFSAIIPWIVGLLFGPAAQSKYGLTTFNARLVTGLFGLGTIWLVLSLRKRLGTIGTLASAALLALSPGAVYLSRYFIHESLFVFFTLGVVAALVKYYDDGHPVYMILAGASAALLFATKETWIISAGVFLIALPSTHIYRWLFRTLWLGASTEVKRLESTAVWIDKTVERLGGPVKIAVVLGVTVRVVCPYIAVLFYSSFFTNANGVSDSLKTFQIWSKTGQQAHVHAWWTYFQWLAEQESSLLLLGLFGTAAALLKPKNSLAVFVALWTIGILAAYSIVPYKTPWLALNFIVPLALMGGYAFQAFYEFAGKDLMKTAIVTAAVWAVSFFLSYEFLPRPIAQLWLNFLAPLVLIGIFAFQAFYGLASPDRVRTIIVIALVVIGIGFYQTIVLNFFKYDDDHYTYVYAHTRRETLDMLADIDKVAQRNGTGFDTGIMIASPEYWPLPWYFRDYKKVGYYGRVATSNEAIIIASEGQRDEIFSTFGDRYRQVNSKFPLRPGVDLLLFVRKDLVGP